nr:MAG TPA: hypothetical protein [Bacteriophage sp.]
MEIRLFPSLYTVMLLEQMVNGIPPQVGAYLYLRMPLKIQRSLLRLFTMRLFY